MNCVVVTGEHPAATHSFMEHYCRVQTLTKRASGGRLRRQRLLGLPPQLLRSITQHTHIFIRWNFNNFTESGGRRDTGCCRTSLLTAASQVSSDLSWAASQPATALDKKTKRYDINQRRMPCLPENCDKIFSLSLSVRRDAPGRETGQCRTLADDAKVTVMCWQYTSHCFPGDAGESGREGDVTAQHQREHSLGGYLRGYRYASGSSSAPVLSGTCATELTSR
ncbi:hypothetical protein E2C01_072527 [Portunus trituberculatus]|uniref:Uncharacterized protein n=1 Tax=Portunus trituberculatus TaxID=210409 RepID=A0A5B7I6Y6_PORTR|nr:hypothetical protein [Portunus trituberculatus]